MRDVESAAQNGPDDESNAEGSEQSLQRFLSRKFFGFSAEIRVTLTGFAECVIRELTGLLLDVGSLCSAVERSCCARVSAAVRNSEAFCAAAARSSSAAFSALAFAA